jgi:DNA polymerase-3 subunit alpha (Gram-positive type)
VEVADVVRRAAALGHSAIAITDHGVVQAFPDAFDAAKKAKIKVLFGMEGYLMEDHPAASGKERTFHILILARNYRGLENLYRLVSESHLRHFHRHPRFPRELLASLREGLIVGSACESGELFQAVLSGAPDEELERIASFYDFLEIQPLGNNQFMLDNGKVQDIEQLKDINKKIIALGERYHKPVAATCDVHFLDPHDEVYRRILMAGQGFSDADKQAPLYLRTTEEIYRNFFILDGKKQRKLS